jgi:hypothetical protein
VECGITGTLRRWALAEHVGDPATSGTALVFADVQIDCPLDGGFVVAFARSNPPTRTCKCNQRSPDRRRPMFTAPLRLGRSCSSQGWLPPLDASSPMRLLSWTALARLTASR